MKLSKKRAAKECKKLWKEIEKSGLSKFAFFLSGLGRKWENKFRNRCPLCEHEEQNAADEDDACINCLLEIQYGKSCYDLGFKHFDIPTTYWLDKIYGLKE